MTSNTRITALISFGAFAYCLVCCALPGAIALGVLKSIFHDWPTVKAEIVEKKLCLGGVDPDSEYAEFIIEEAESDTDEDILYYVTYNFMTLEGENITATTSYCTNTFSPKVRYDPQDPEDIVDNTLLTIGMVASRVAAGIGWFITIIALIVGVYLCTRPGPRNNRPTATTTATPTSHFQKQPVSTGVTVPNGDATDSDAKFSASIYDTTSSNYDTTASNYDTTASKFSSNYTPMSTSTGGAVTVLK